MKKSINLLLGLLFSVFISYGQQEGGLVKVVVKAPTEIASGDTLFVSATLDILEGYHIYAPIQANASSGMQVSDFYFDPLPEGVQKAGELILPDLEKHGMYDTYWGKNILLKQPFVINGSVKDSVAISGVFSYQACNEEICYPPVDVPFNKVIKIK